MPLKIVVQIMRLPPGNMSWILQIIQIANISASKDLDHEVGDDHLSLWKYSHTTHLVKKKQYKISDRQTYINGQ